MKVKLYCLSLVLIMLITIFCSCNDDKNEENTKDLKPVIYLYPEEKTNISVKLEYCGRLTCTYPLYNNSWNVIAYPDGTIKNLEDNKEYSYLYWEGESDIDWDIDEGFVVKGDETAEFLQEKLSFLGLEPKEYNEFIVFWLPLMLENKYNMIYFAGEDYTESAKLKVTPKPESIQRVHIVFKGLDEYKQIKEQVLKPFNRKGYTLIEWGGTEIK